jgi:DNA processing protein
MKVKIISLRSKNYPLNLKAIKGAPPKIYIKGNLKKSDILAVAIVGSRKMSKRGAAAASRFTRELASKGVTIVSGLARGIDTVAHKTALETGGRTIAVLGSGIDVIYPWENRVLADEVSGRGALVSEFPSQTPPLAKNFLTRNRIISGLALAVLVIEGERKSGTLSTAAHAANQGREVFVLPGTGATDYLADQGARICQNPGDILEYLSHESHYC